MEDFRKIFTGLERAQGCTYVDKKGADGLKVKGKSFVKREVVTDKHWEDLEAGDGRLDPASQNYYGRI